MSKTEKNGFKCLRKRVGTPLDRLLIRITMKAFDWKFLQQSEIPYYTVSDEGEKHTHLKKYYYFARPSNYSKNILFHLFYFISNISRFFRKLSFPFIILFGIGGALIENLGILPTDLFIAVAVIAAFVYAISLAANILSAALGFICRPWNKKSLSQNTEQRAKKFAEKRERQDLYYAEDQEYYADLKAERAKEEYEARRIQEEKENYQYLVSEYNYRINQINEAKSMARRAANDPYLSENEKLVLMDTAKALMEKSTNEAYYFASEMKKYEN